MNIIQDYMNRANISDSKLNDLKNTLESKKDVTTSDFKKELDEKLLGKVSSSQIVRCQRRI